MEPSKPLQACTEMALPLLLISIVLWSFKFFKIYHYSYILLKKGRQEFVVCGSPVTYAFSSNPL
jgi:hypothetical protein